MISEFLVCGLNIKPAVKSQRIKSYDILRTFACLMIIAMHAPIPGAFASSNGLFLSTLSYLTAPGIGLFFLISGASRDNVSGYSALQLPYGVDHLGLTVSAFLHDDKVNSFVIFNPVLF